MVRNWEGNEKRGEKKKRIKRETMNKQSEIMKKQFEKKNHNTKVQHQLEKKKIGN